MSFSFLSEPRPKNLAKGKPTWQIDNHVPYTSSSKAVDGNKDPVLGHKSCACTKYQLYAWWAVDLKKKYTITKVEITNRLSSGKLVRR